MKDKSNVCFIVTYLRWRWIRKLCNAGYGGIFIISDKASSAEHIFLLVIIPNYSEEVGRLCVPRLRLKTLLPRPYLFRCLPDCASSRAAPFIIFRSFCRARSGNLAEIKWALLPLFLLNKTLVGLVIQPVVIVLIIMKPARPYCPRRPSSLFCMLSISPMLCMCVLRGVV